LGVGDLWGEWELRLVGVVEMRSQARTAFAAGSRKERTLLAFLGTRPGRVVAVDEIVEALWNGRRPRLPEANVATLVSRLRSRFGADTITGGRDGYRLGDTVLVDLEEAASLVTEAETLLRSSEPALGLIAASRALKLLGRGPVLVDHPADDWAEQARDRQAGLLRRARVSLGEAALHTGEPGQAHLTAEAAIAADPLDEAAYRVLMRACATVGEPARAIRAYQQLRRVLASELGTDPAPATHELYLAVLRGGES
jgi:DNA-binding SARP family transcriptional activator